jgi:hypothetical protein
MWNVAGLSHCWHFIVCPSIIEILRGGFRRRRSAEESGDESRLYINSITSLFTKDSISPPPHVKERRIYRVKLVILGCFRDWLWQVDVIQDFLQFDWRHRGEHFGEKEDSAVLPPLRQEERFRNEGWESSFHCYHPLNRKVIFGCFAASCYGGVSCGGIAADGTFRNTFWEVRCCGGVFCWFMVAHYERGG